MTESPILAQQQVLSNILLLLLLGHGTGSVSFLSVPHDEVLSFPAVVHARQTQS